METRIDLGGIAAEVAFKDIKNVHLSVYPPDGKVRISAPAHMNLDTIRVFAISRLPWIRQQREKLRGQPRETPREYLERESHYVWGRRYLLRIIEADVAPDVCLKHRHMVLRIRPGTTGAQRQAIVEAWYREQVRRIVPAMIAKWEPLMGVKIARFFVQRMKTKWGSCSPASRSIRLNTELAKKPRECLEYIVVHEMAHLLEPTHNARFAVLMDRFMASSRMRRDQLNQLPVRHEAWGY
jgi:predicted metal-dependent hydrolase